MLEENKKEEQKKKLEPPTREIIGEKQNDK